MDRDLNMKSEAILIVKASAIFTVMQLILDFVHPFFDSYDKSYHLFFDLGFLIILCFFTLEYLVKGNDYENEPENQDDRSYRPILWRLLVDVCFVLLAFSIFLGIVLCCVSQMDQLDTIHRHPSFLDKILMRPSPDEQAKQIIQDYFDNTGYFFRILTSLVNSFMYISCARFIIVLGQLIINSVSGLFTRN